MNERMGMCPLSEFSVFKYYKSLLERLDEKYKADREEIMVGWRKEQAECKHEHTDWEPDPSGNNDSTHWCKDCGKTGRAIYQLQQKRGQR